MPARNRLALLSAVVLAGCGGAAERPAPTATPRPATRAAFDLPGKKLVYVWRNFEFTGIPEEMTVYQNGDVRYRNLLHTQTTIKVMTDKLSPGRLARLRRLVAAVDVERADASGVKPVRSGYRYIVRVGQAAGTAADGHLHGAMKRLVIPLRAEMDHLQANSL